jgi:Fe-S-cluster containining protein
MYLGDYIVIDTKTGPYSFSCSCVSTNTHFLAVVDEDKREIFDREWFSRQHPHACPFLRPADDGRIVCTIHETSPAQCKIYRCVAVRIYSGEQQVGYITGMGALHSDDQALRSLYESCASQIPKEDQERDEWLARYFEKHGYRTE